MISIKGIHKFFNKGKGNEIHVINGATIDLPERGMTAIFGKSGCGKTTLLNVIGGLDSFSEGTLTIEGRDIRKNTDDIRNEYIGYIFQNYNLNNSESCKDNVAAALRLCGMRDEEEIEKRSMAALAAVDMEKYAKRTPDTLSGGQQQRIAIARAIVKNPKIILADEPTGNLDEANTLMIMDLLRAISKEHLVLLVTHEANLVEYYCDRVIEISDGKIESVREINGALGYYGRDKNVIYLGELERRESGDSLAKIEYYGDAPDSPIGIRVVNKNGKLYLQLMSDKVSLIDETSEIKLLEGKFQEQSERDVDDIDMSHFPRIKTTNPGRLFTLRSSIISGYKAAFKSVKRGGKALRRCMILFSAAVVFMSAVFGTSIGKLLDVSDAYNHNVFYVYTPDSETSDKLNAALSQPDSAVDYVRLHGVGVTGDRELYFSMSVFETFNQYYFNGGFTANGVQLGGSLAKDKELLAGRNAILSPEEIIISDKVADMLIEKASLGYITEYKDLIGITSTSFSINGRTMKVVGVVKSGESAVYFSDLAMAKYVGNCFYRSYAELASDYGLDLQQGEAIAVLERHGSGADAPKLNEKITLYGRELTVTRIIKEYDDYAAWLTGSEIKKASRTEYFTAILLANRPELDIESSEFASELANLTDERYYEYFDYYYDRLDEFLRDQYMLGKNNFDLWLYFDKGISDVRSLYVNTNYYAALKHKEVNGSYPRHSEFTDEWSINMDDYDFHKSEFHSIYRPSIYGDTILVSDEDYISASSRLGKNDERIGDAATYTILHSTDPAKTEKWLEGELSYLTSEEIDAIITPEDVFKAASYGAIEEIVGRLISMLALLGAMSACMYFIMRSLLMNRIKEIGIYRAIGVSRRNLVFKFLVESLVLTALSTLVGFVLASAYIFMSLSLSPLSAEIFFYPTWYMLLLGAFITLLSIICGILPICLLLRKTPSEILAKYDI